MLGMLIYYDASMRTVEIRRSQVMPLWLARELGVAYIGASLPDGAPLTTRDGDVAVMADFAAHEERGGALIDYGANGLAVGAATWPEWLHGRDVRNCDLELEPGWSRHTSRSERPDYRIAALVHKTSGYRRERAAIEEAIADRIIVAHAEASATGREPVADLRTLVGGPDRPLRLDDDGRTIGRSPATPKRTER